LNKPVLKIMGELESQGIKDLLDEVYHTGVPFSATELPVQLLRNGNLETAYINFVYEALYDVNNNVNGIITIGFEVTEQVLTRKNIELSQAEQYSLNEELTASNEALLAINEELTDTQGDLKQINAALEKSESRFRNLIQQAPVAICIFRGRELLIEAANLKMQEMLSKDGSIVGKTFAKAVPELEGQPFFELLDNVFNTGNVYYGYEQLAVIDRDGILSDGYFNFIYHPLKDENNITDGIMVVAIDVTETVRSRKEIEWAYEQARLSKEAAQLGTFDMDLNEGTLEWDERCRLLFGINHKKKVTYEEDFVNACILMIRTGF